jgi:hypothetical protein
MTYVPPHLAVVQFLLALPTDEQAKIADTNTDYGRLIFRDALPLKLSGTGLRAVVLKAGPGINPSVHAQGSIVSACLYADHTRVDGKPPATEDGIDRAWAMFGNVDAHLQAADPLTSGAETMQSDRQAQPLETFDRDQDLPYLAIPYNVTLYAER